MDSILNRFEALQGVEALLGVFAATAALLGV